MPRITIYDYRHRPGDDPDQPAPARVVGWFDPDKATAYAEQLGGDDGRLSLATGKVGHHQELYRTSSGKWVLCSWSRYAGTTARHEYLAPDQARDWLLSQGHDGAVQEHFAATPAESGPGRPVVGPKREVRLPPEKWQQIDAYAQTKGMSGAAALREVIDLGLEAISPTKS